MLRVILLLGIFQLAQSTFPIDNEIVGEPTVDCEDTLVGLTFKTKKPFSGRVYVQGLSDDSRCSRAFIENRNQSRMSMEVKNGDCTMQRHRVTGKMEGLMFSLTIVVSFHGTFVTRADRAFRCICFFRNQKTLTNSIQIGPIGTTELLNTVPMPTCSYSIRSGTRDGPPIVFGRVGERIFHVWQCDIPDKGFLVHSCHVTDGRGFRFDLLDVDGCAIDPVIQPDVVYNHENNTAVAETYGYKFSDTNVLNYECVVEICSRSMGECDGLTPPVCEREETPSSHGLLRKRRTVRAEARPGSVEVAATISMMDNMKEAVVREPEASGMPDIQEGLDQMINIPKDCSVMCLSPLYIALLTVGLSLFCTLCIFIVCYLSRRRTYVFSSADRSKGADTNTAESGGWFSSFVGGSAQSSHHHDTSHGHSSGGGHHSGGGDGGGGDVGGHGGA